MIRSHNHSSFPRVGETVLDQQLRAAWRQHAAGTASLDDVDAVADQVITIAVAEQSRAFLDIVTDGMVRHDGPQAHLLRWYEGLEPGPLVRWFDTNFYQRRLEVRGEVRRRGPFLVRDFQVASNVARKQLVKVVLPGPVTTARLAHDEHYRSVERLAEALANALRDEVADLAAAGAKCFQLEEPLLCAHPEDLDLVARTARSVFATAGDGATTILSTYFGDLAPLASRLGELPGTHLGFDATHGATDLTLLDRLPAGRGVSLGLFDARTTRIEDASAVAQRLAPHRDALVARDVIVGPNGGLELLPRDQAFDKLLHTRYLVEQLGREWTWPS